MKLTVGMKVVVYDAFGRGFDGEIINISDYREPSMKYAVYIGLDDYVFVGEESIRAVEEVNDENN